MAPCKDTVPSNDSRPDGTLPTWRVIFTAALFGEVTSVVDDATEMEEAAELPFAERLRGFSKTVIALSGCGALVVLGVAATRFDTHLLPSQLVLFYGVPLLWIVMSAVTLREGAEAQLAFAILQCSLGVALVLGEFGAALWMNSGAVAVTRPSVREELRQLRASGVDAFPKIAGNQVVDLSPRIVVGEDTLRPVSPGPGHATIRLCDEDRPMLTYRADRYGFDNPDTAWDASPNSVTFVGDSYTVGVCVPADSAIPGRVREKRAVINVGSSGSGPLQQLAMLREYASLVRSKQVVWILYEGNDYWDLPREAERDWLVKYLEPRHSQSLRAHEAELNAGYRVWIDSLFNVSPPEVQPPPKITLRDVLALRALRTLLPARVPFPRQESRIGLLPQVLARARADVRNWGGELIVVYMPAFLRYRTLVGDPYPERAEVLMALRGLGIRTVDLHETFLATGDPKSLWVTPRSHLTSAGYALASETIAKALQQTHSTTRSCVSSSAAADSCVLP
jgi:hypothetical protein